MNKQSDPKTLDNIAVIEILQKGTIVLEGQFALGSNYTFLVNLAYHSQTIQAVYKPLKGEVPLWDFPTETLAARETAAYILSEALHWDLVPPTIIREDGPFGKGSLQLFIRHDPNLHYFSFDTVVREQLQTTALFDIVINNADRKGSHIILDESGHIWLIDHGLCFHVSAKLRTVIWDFSGETIHADLIARLKTLLNALENHKAIYTELAELLSTAEIDALKKRILFIIKHPIFPSPDKNKRQIPWPLV